MRDALKRLGGTPSPPGRTRGAAGAQTVVVPAGHSVTVTCDPTGYALAALGLENYGVTSATIDCPDLAEQGKSVLAAGTAWKMKLNPEAASGPLSMQIIAGDRPAHLRVGFVGIPKASTGGLRALAQRLSGAPQPTIPSPSRTCRRSDPVALAARVAAGELDPLHVAKLALSVEEMAEFLAAARALAPTPAPRVKRVIRDPKTNLVLGVEES